MKIESMESTGDVYNATGYKRGTVWKCNIEGIECLVFVHDIAFPSDMTEAQKAIATTLVAEYADIKYRDTRRG